MVAISLAFRLHKTLDEILDMPSLHLAYMAAFLRITSEDLATPADEEEKFLKVFGAPNVVDPR